MAHRVLKPLAASLLLCEVAWGTVVVIASSEGGIGMDTYLVYVFGGLIFAALGFVWVLVALVLSLQGGRELPWAVLDSRVLIQPVLLGAIFSMCSLGVGFRIRLEWSKSALLEYAIQKKVEAPVSQSTRVGLFEVRYFDSPGGTARFLTADCGFDECGIAYNPVGVPDVVGEDSYEPLGSGWWWWHQSW